MDGHSGPRSVRIRYLRPPDREEVFVQQLVWDGPSVKVTLASDMTLAQPKHIADEVVLETGSSVVWFTFPDVWHDIGRFHDREGRFTGLYANVLTPPEFLPGDVWTTTDLYLDVWMDPAGKVELLDHDQLAQAVASGLVSTSLGERATREARHILRLAGRGAWPPPVVHEWTLERAVAAARATEASG